MKDEEAVVNLRIGARVRELRDAAGLSLKALAQRMTEAGHDWTWQTVNRVQGGLERRLLVAEVVSLARIFGVTTDDILMVPLAEVDRARPLPRTPRRRVGAFPEDLSPGLSKLGQSERLPPFPPAPGQIERLEALAEELGVSRAEALRRAMEVGLRAYEKERQRRG